MRQTIYPGNDPQLYSKSDTDVITRLGRIMRGTQNLLTSLMVVSAGIAPEGTRAASSGRLDTGVLTQENGGMRDWWHVKRGHDW